MLVRFFSSFILIPGLVIKIFIVCKIIKERFHSINMLPDSFNFFINYLLSQVDFKTFHKHKGIK